MVLAARKRHVGLAVDKQKITSWVQEDSWAKEHKLEHRSRRSHPHDGLWMPFHDAVLEVEPLKITNRRRLDHLGKTETMPTDLGDLGAVEAEEEELVVD